MAAQKKILVLIYYPSKWVLKANVLSSATTKDIKQLIPNKDVAFLHNGIYLSDTHSFNFYGVKERDVIVVIPNTQSRPISDKWANLMCDKDLFRERVSSVIDPKTSREAAKLRDFQMLRMERKPKVYRKLCASFPSNAENTQLRISSSPSITEDLKTIVPETALNGPSKDPLPIFWSRSETIIAEPPQEIVPASIITQEKTEEVTTVREDFKA